MAVPPGRQRDPNHEAKLLLSMIPEEIRKSASPAELVERIAKAQTVAAQAGDGRLDPLLRSEAKMHARQILSAPVPARKAVPQRPATQARRLTAVAKAKTDPPVPVFDQDGNLIGVCDPDDLTQLATTGQPDLNPVPSADVGLPAGEVAKAAGQVVVYDERRRAYRTDRRNVLVNVVKGTPADDDTVTLYDIHGRPYQVNRAAIQPPEAQARNTGPVRAGGTTGLGQPRQGTPPKRLPGDVPDRTVVKSQPGWIDVYGRSGRRAGVMQQSKLVTQPRGGVVRIAKAQVADYASVYDATGRYLGAALRRDILRTRDGR